MRIVIILLFVTLVTSRITIPDLNISYISAHLTPRGYDWPEISESGKLIMEDSNLDGSLYNNSIVMMRFRPNWDIDVCKYQDLGAKCVIVEGTTYFVPGFIIIKGDNNCNYNCAVDMNAGDFALLMEIYHNFTIASNYRTYLHIEVDSSDGNQWKEMSNSALIWLTQIPGGMESIIITIWSIYELVRIRTYPDLKMLGATVVCSLLLSSGLLGIVGFIDFDCLRQVMNHRVCNFFTSARISPIFSACYWLVFLMMETGKISVKIDYGFPDHIKFFIPITILLVATDYICSILITYLSTAVSIITLLIIWLSIILGLVCLCAIFMTIVSINTLKRLSTSIKMYKRQELKPILTRLMVVLIIISISLFSYVVVAGVTNYTINYPYPLAGTFFTYNMLLNIISFSLAYNTHKSINGRISGVIKKVTTSGSSSNHTETNTGDGIHSVNLQEI